MHADPTKSSASKAAKNTRPLTIDRDSVRAETLKAWLLLSEFIVGSGGQCQPVSVLTA
jgi:hypothetical protein